MAVDSTLGMSPGQARGFAAPDGSGMMFPVVRGRPGGTQKTATVDAAPSASGALLSYLVRTAPPLTSLRLANAVVTTRRAPAAGGACAALRGGEVNPRGGCAPPPWVVTTTRPPPGPTPRCTPCREAHCLPSAAGAAAWRVRAPAGGKHPPHAGASTCAVLATDAPQHGCPPQVIALVVFLFFGGMVPSGAGSLLRWRSPDGWSPCSNPCGPGIQARVSLRRRSAAAHAQLACPGG